MARATRPASSSSSPTEPSSENPSTIQVQLPPWVIVEARLPFSALSAEKSGDEWFLSIALGDSYGLKHLLKFPARDITINGKSLDRFLEGIGMTRC